MLKVSEWVKKFSKVSVILAVAGLVIKPATFTVHADDSDFYLPVDEYTTYVAWQFFSNYGYNGDSSRTYSNVYTGTGSFTTSATITLSTGGGGDYADTYSSVNVIDGNFIQNFEITVETAPATLDITAVRSSNYTANLSATCTSTGSLSSGANTGYACTYQDFEMFTSYDMDNPLSGNLTLLVEPTSATGNGSNYNLRLVSAETGHTEGAFTISESSSGTYSGAGTFTFNMSTLNTNTFAFKLPFVSTTSINNDYFYAKRITIPRTYSDGHQYCWVMAFLTDLNDNYSSFNPEDYIEGVYDVNGNKLTKNTDYKIIGNSYNQGSMAIKSIRLWSTGNTGTSVWIKFKTLPNNQNIEMVNRLIPIYVGNDYRMSEDLYRYVFGDSINKEIIDSVTNQNDQFDNVGNNLTSFESSSESSMNTSLSNIPLNNGIGSNSNFLNSALWVKNRFEDLVLNTPFESLIVFSLTIGISLTIIGKLRNR